MDLIALSLLLAFALSLSIAMVYKYLNRGVSQTRTFPQTLAVAGIVSAVVVLSVGDNIARGIGLVGALTVIRFRSNLQDPRDLIFALASLATGVAVGAHAYPVAVMGTIVFLAATIIVSRPWFTRTNTFHAILSFQVPESTDGTESISRVLRSQCHEFALVRLRQSSPGMQEHAYQIRLKQPSRQADLLRELERIGHIHEAAMIAYDGGIDS